MEGSQSISSQGLLEVGVVPDKALIKPPYIRQEFERFAPLYDPLLKMVLVPFGGEQRFRSRLVDKLELEKKHELLDICCGTSTCGVIAAARGVKVTGADISLNMLKIAHKKASRKGLAFKGIQANAENIPLPDASYDRILISFGLHEMPLNAAQNALNEAHRLVKPGGKVVILDYHRPGGSALDLVSGVFFKVFEEDGSFEFSRTDLVAMTEKAGFKEVIKQIKGRGLFQQLECLP